MWVNYTSIFFIETICCIRRMWVRYTPIPFNWQSAAHAFFVLLWCLNLNTYQKFESLYPRKANCNIVALLKRISFLSYCMRYVCAAVPPAVRPTHSRQMNIGSLTYSQIWDRVVHTTGDQGQTRLHKSWLGGTGNLALTLPRQGIQSRVFRLWMHVFQACKEYGRKIHWEKSEELISPSASPSDQGGRYHP